MRSSSAVSVSRVSRRIVAPIVTALACMALLAVLAPSPALAKDYVIDDVKIQSRIERNGDLVVAEQRTFEFNGDFSRVFWDVPTAQTGGLRVQDVVGPDGQMMERVKSSAEAAARPEGKYFVIESAGQTRIEAYFRGGGTKTFKLDYTVVGGAKKYTDVSELYWKAIGDGWAVPTRHASIVVKMPPNTPAEQVKAWAHGPLNGTVRITSAPGQDSETAGTTLVTLNVSDVPANQFVEVRIAFPTSSLPLAATQPGGPRAPTIMAEEKKNADEANSRRMAAQATMGFAWAAELILFFGGIGLALWAWLKHGREYRSNVFDGKYFREIPSNDPPAVVGALMRWGKVENSDFSATIMQMADDKAVTLEPVTTAVPGLFGGHDEKTFKLTVNREQLAASDEVAQALGTAIFDKIAGADTVTVEELKAKAKSEPQHYKDAVDDWRSKAEGMAAAKGWFEADSQSWMAGLYVAAFVVAGASVGLMFWTGSWWFVVLGLIAAAVIAVVANLTKRRSLEGADLFNKYKALERYLKDFSRLDEAPPSSVILWNRFLVLAVVFGIAKEVLEQLKTRMPEVVEDPGFAMTYWMLSPYSGWGGAPVDMVGGGFESAASIATSELSSASGGGGGFSGGGGGGFGGGGGGAD